MKEEKKKWNQMSNDNRYLENKKVVKRNKKYNRDSCTEDIENFIMQ